MNRALIFGIAIFFAVVGIALVGGQSNAVMAGHGCHGCSGCDCSEPAPAPSCDCGGCHKRHRLFGHHKKKCCAPEPTCCAPAAPACEPACPSEPACPGGCTTAAPVEAAPAPPAPPAPAPAPAPAPPAPKA